MAISAHKLYIIYKADIITKEIYANHGPLPLPVFALRLIYWHRTG